MRCERVYARLFHIHSSHPRHILASSVALPLASPNCNSQILSWSLLRERRYGCFWKTCGLRVFDL